MAVLAPEKTLSHWPCRVAKVVEQNQLLFKKKSEGRNAGSLCTQICVPMESHGSPLTLGTRQVFSATRQVVLLAFINQVLNIVCYPAFISPALKGWIRKHLAHCWAVTLWNMCKSDQELRGSTQKPCRSCPVLTILRPLRNLLASAGNHYSGLFMYCCF